MSQGWNIPAYNVRESKRARRVTIKVSSRAGLEVVVPVGFDQSELPAILQAKAGWITNNLQKTRPVEGLDRPDFVGLRLLGETWRTEYYSSPDERLSLSEREGNLLSLTGPVDDPAGVAAALNQWLQRRAKDVLVPWLHRLSAQLSLPFSRATVRRQRTKWGSCSSEKSISLNRNLLFLPEPMARYVLVHELCHGRRWTIRKNSGSCWRPSSPTPGRPPPSSGIQWNSCLIGLKSKTGGFRSDTTACLALEPAEFGHRRPFGGAVFGRRLGCGVITRPCGQGLLHRGADSPRDGAAARRNDRPLLR
jgi:predicted metal-dependent hydrolase